jgi:hypothetical protein
MSQGTARESLFTNYRVLETRLVPYHILSHHITSHHHIMSQGTAREASPSPAEGEGRQSARHQLHRTLPVLLGQKVGLQQGDRSQTPPSPHIQRL